MDHPFISTLTRSGPVGQTILVGLLLLSIHTWTIIFWKRAALRRAEKSSREFLGRFRKAAREWLVTGRDTPVGGPLGALYQEGLREFRIQREIAGAGRPLGPEALPRIEAVLEMEATDQIHALERGHLVLAIAASASPFIGLFGTVWGIMNAFRGMSAEGSAGIAAVAPGVAEALVTTVAGLAVAIPAVIAYNVLNRRVQVIVAVLDRFSAEFLREVQHEVHRGPGPPPAAGSESASPVFARRNA